jgi:hypothetical protein
MITLDALNTPKRGQTKGYEILVIKKKKISIQWTDKQVTRLRKEKKASLKKKKEKSHKIILNALIMTNQNIMPGITIRN